MTQRLRTLGYSATLVAIFAMLVSSGATVNAQQAPAPGQLLSPDQLDYLVAPIALYPDPLISQILVATTYPLEIVEASQWLQRNPNTRGAALTQAALDQDWDPSIQALVVFPDVLKYLTEDISWTTNLGNAFLAQEADVMDAIQRMRDRAAQSGKLKTTAEQQVIQTYDAGQPVYEIVPTNPTVIYVPVYDPYWIWGVPVYYPYARWYYPPHAPYLYFNSGIYIDAYFGSSWYGSASYGPGYRVWNNWGWRPAWNTHTVVVNNVFIDNHRFNSNQPRYATATTSWSHDASHRRGVVYPTSASYDRFRRDPRDVPRPQQVSGQGRSVPAQTLTRNTGPSNVSSAPRPVDRSNDRTDGRPDFRQDGRQDVRQDGRQTAPQAGRDVRPDFRQDSRQDSRIASGSAASNAPNNVPNRDNRGSSDFRNDRGNMNSGSSRVGSSPAQIATTLPTHVTPAQVTLSRPTTPAPDLSQSRAVSQAQPGFRESQVGRNTASSVTRTTSQAPSRDSMTARVGQQEYSSRQSDPYRGAANSNVQASVSRQTSPGRQAAPSGSYGPSQQTRSSGVAPSIAQQSAPRQSASAPASGSASVGRAAPAQSGPPSNSQGSAQGGGQGSNSGSRGGGNSGGRR